MNYYKKIILLLFISLPLFANVGKVSQFSGLVFIERDSNNVPIEVDTVLEKEDVIRTIGNSKVQIRFEDQTIITIGKDSAFKVQEYLYDTVQEKNSKADFVFFKGGFRLVTGGIGKINKEKFILQTKSASIGIRGTVIFGDQAKIAFTEGRGYVSALNVIREVATGFMVRTEPNQPPSTPVPIPQDFLESFVIESGLGRDQLEIPKLDLSINSTKNNKEQSKIKDTNVRFEGHMLGYVKTKEGKIDTLAFTENLNSFQLKLNDGKLSGTIAFKTRSGQIWRADINSRAATINDFNLKNIKGIGNDSPIKNALVSSLDVDNETISGKLFISNGNDEANVIFTLVKKQ